MKKLTTGLLVLVLSSSIAVAHAQEKKDTIKTKEIEGVVVTALGIKREKKSLGYASQEIKAGALSDGTTNTGNIAAQLSGKVAGLNVTTNNNFGGSSNLVIRGVKSLAGGNPLIVIDGSPVNNTNTQANSLDYGNALSDINQDDIESINVLKGAAASALYGDRGLNGVIVITTKNGKGKDDGSWGVTFSSAIQVGFIDKSTFPEYQTRYGAGYAQKFGAQASDGLNYANFGADASWGPKFDPNLMVYQWDSFNPSSPNYKKATPWVAAKNGPITFFNNPASYINSVTLEKGQKGKNISFTYENMMSDGLMPNSHLNKNNFSLKVNYDLTPKLHSSFYSTMTLQETKGRSITGYSNNIATGFRQWWQTNVDVKDLEQAYLANIDPHVANASNNYGNVTWSRKSATNGAPAYWNNPYFQAYQNYSSDKRYRSFTYGQVTYDLFDNISVTGKVSYDRTNLTADTRLAVGSLPQAFGQSNNVIGSGYGRRDILQTETNYDLMVNYKFDITDNINISGVVGGNIRRNYDSSIYASTEGGLIVPGIYALSNSKKAPLAPDENVSTQQTNSLFATASFDFYKKFYLDATWRRAEVSTLNPDNNIYNYPSITGSLIMSEILDTKRWMNFWKIRANYAEVGGTANPYQLVNNYKSAGILNGTGIYNPILNQPFYGLMPQRAKEFEIGTEVHFLRDRITLDVAYYKTKTNPQILSPLPTSAAIGYTGKVFNAGRIDNSGVEVQLGLVPIKTKDFTWNIDANWSKNQNEVVNLYPGINNYLLNSFQGGVSLNARVGEAWGTLIGSDYTYLNGQKVIDPKTGKYLQNPNQVIGNTTPDWIGGIRNSFSYKGFSLSFLIDMRKGGDVFSTDMYYGLSSGLYKETAVGDYRDKPIVLPGVLPDGTPNNIQLSPFADNNAAMGYKTQPSREFVYDGSFIKLREASIGYMLPKSLLEGTKIYDAKISIVGRNLWIIHKNLPYADPEAMVGGGINSYGWSIGSMPTTRDIGVNVTFKF
ncbi:SusC/RagA family TonB-linked outer membrane protein [Chryseobacterium indologenes]|uniref:SusC/RagA family TonB-linked outer membrane protein n=1 Tax=Chryseobacterium indologenes TaxID=253 RepID=A0AAD0YX83_CHRID|nr:SusC/RagA family TonB-linked outer membrane protein [Chryseobacterium indologenes]ASE62735.1 SusC/RagA family TonB-linked outer membrane protein [Chryseobacterium indologenes]AYZ34365.1 SusC/RagA family TonB-linked outer membrane protein [Chryseobacterium indologenes]AZB18436.1 SusC/RagA family TonB-linked outer membrane protein [Chryseobacterium indologenes]MBF6642909.1 SusC/RagA family TonB-linked outer membrane protein [Chryseobacterium indologenes]MBU3050134.1 SusC/RagA family TonB-link